ncbi:uncharacterized protein [Narcine bancroftii]|uniref:uncharacterized protein n=1 Tax=Narcine bancroftii TaxID=1343680 RepID=UPI003831839C
MSSLNPSTPWPTDSLLAPTALPDVTPKCYLCGRDKHSRSQCLARKARCQKCLKNGHFAIVCRSKMATIKHSASCEGQPPPSHSNNSSSELSSNESEGSTAQQPLTSRGRATTTQALALTSTTSAIAIAAIDAANQRPTTTNAADQGPATTDAADLVPTAATTNDCPTDRPTTTTASCDPQHLLLAG